MANEKERIEEIYHLALEKKDKKERSAYLDSACGDDSKLRAAVEGLLQAHDKAGNFLEVPPFDPDVTMDTSPLTEGPGTTIGNYKLLEQIGEGGMAVVYMAEQEKPLCRRVALKIIKLGMDTKSVIARFEVERQALAVMDHPNIAKVFDAGTTETGRPYFVMELVRGVSISEYCDKNKLNTKERLDLFIQVCNAVQHAHQKGIIHRDIKPSNVMVTLHDGKPVPKVIDFGIAKATSQRLTEKTLFTRYAQMIGTPAYMSPEQAEMSGLDIDTRTDIYSLGILLYELLTGTTPFSEEQLREAGYLEMQRIIREEEPLKPSTKLSTLGDTLTDVAKHRKASPDLLQKLIRGDLDWIVMKSLEKDRTRRYDTTAEMVADIARHLNHEPVLAGPPSQIYRLTKFIRRHRTQAISAMMVAVLLASMAVIFAMYIKSINREKVSEFLVYKDILSKAIEFRSRGQFQEALTKVETILSSEYLGPEARLLRARLILELQGPADAVKELDKLLKERDDIACQAHLLLARIYLESASGDPERTEEYQQKAQEHQQKGEKLFSESAEAYFNRAMIVGTVKKTLECLNKAVELEQSHYPSRKARALTYFALRDYLSMEHDAVAMITLRDWDSLGYSLLAIALRERENFSDAFKYHNKAIEISPDEAELYDQRRRTHMRMGNYEQALLNARKCVELEAEEGTYHLHVFCALVGLGSYDEATAKYETIIESGLMSKQYLDLSAAKYVSDTLDSGLLWHPPESRPEGAAFLVMCESAEVYHQLAKKAKRIVPEGFQASWSPDCTKIVYSRGILGSSSIEILDLETGKTELLTTPGKDPDWSPDGKYVAYVRDQQILGLGQLTDESDGKPKDPTDFLKEEVWLIRADGTKEPRFLSKGGWPCWSSDSKRVFYHSRSDDKLYSMSIFDGTKPTPIVRCLSAFPAVSPDEKFIAYELLSEGRYIKDVSTNLVVASWDEPLLGEWSFLSWSPDGQELSSGQERDSGGLWIYDVRRKKASKVLSGEFGTCIWSPDMRQMLIQRQYGTYNHAIWVANLDPNVSTAESLGPRRSIEEHCHEMVDFYSRRTKFEPENEKNYLSRAECYMYLQNQEKTFTDLKKYASIVKNSSKIAATYDKLAWPLVFRPQDLVNPEISVELYQKACEIDPDKWIYLRGLGVAHYRARQWEKAITVLTKSIKLFGERGEYFFLMSMAHWQLGDKSAAANWYNKGIEFVRERNIDDASLRMLNLYSFYLEAIELMGIKVKRFDRNAPLTGKQILPVMARANSSHAEMVLGHILEGKGLVDADGDGLLEHGEDPGDMWFSEISRTNSWIEFDLGAMHDLGSILVWNYNERDMTKRGIKTADISVWTQDNNWQKILEDFKFAEAEGSFDYDEPIVVKFEGVKAQKVRFDDIISLGDEGCVGLSEVQFFKRRGPEAIRPYPPNGTDIRAHMELKLSWTPGLGVKAQKVYFGTNPDDLKYIDRFEVGDPSEVKLSKLENGQKYWWRVDAEESDGSITTGELWSFSMGNLIGWWEFNEIEGHRTTDSSGNDLQGKLIGDAHIISDPLRSNVLSLDGDGDYVNCGNNLIFDITNSITVVTWIKVKQFNKPWQAIVTKGDSAWRLQRNAYDSSIEFACAGLKVARSQWGHVLGNVSVNDGKWHHVTGVYDGNKIYLYVDGLLDKSVDASGNIKTNNQPVFIGENSESIGREWNGFIDDVRIYSYALSEVEVKEVYAGRDPNPNERSE